MGMFITLSITFSVLLAALIMLGGIYTLAIGGVILVGMLFAALYTSYTKTQEDLKRIEKKLDQLLAEKTDKQS